MFERVKERGDICEKIWFIIFMVVWFCVVVSGDRSISLLVFLWNFDLKF